MRVLITGYLGYIGTVMAPMFFAEGHDVVGLDSDLYRNCTFGDGLVQVPSISKDIRDVEIEDVKDFDAVCYLSGLSNDLLGDFNPELTYNINHKASVRLAALSKEACVRRFIFSSSCSCYGSAGDDMEMLSQGLREFRQKCSQKIDYWLRTIRKFARDGQRTVLWGSGSKAVAFLTTLKLTQEIEYVVDINPYKHRKNLPGTDHEIVAPQFLTQYKPHKIIVMNPIYCDDIQHDLDDLNVKADLLAV